MTMNIKLGLLAGALAACAAWTAPAAAQIIAIQNARVMTMGPGGVIENGDVIVRNGVIAQVGVDLPAPEGATIIDAAGRVVTPGLFAPFSQVGLFELGLDDEANDSSPQGDFALGAALDALDAYNPSATAIAVARAGGVTRALSAPQPGPGSLFGGRGAVVDLSGRIGSVTKPQAIQFAVMGYGGAQREGDTRMGSWAVLRETLDEASSYAANPRDYVTRPHEGRFSVSDLKALGPVISGAQPLMVRVDGAVDIRNLLRLKNDYRLNVIIIGGAEAWRVAREIAAANVPVIIDATANLPASFEVMGATMENAARLHAAGVRISFENSTAFLRILPQSAGIAVANGLPHEAALAALTINPATMFGLQDRLGSLEVGKAGDVVVWDGDPLEVTTRPTHVLIDGRAMSLENRQTRLRDRYRDLSRGNLPHAYRGEN